MDAETTQPTDMVFLKTTAWLHANRKPLMIGVGVAAVVALAIGFYSWQKSETEVAASGELLSVPLYTIQGTQVMPAPSGPFDAVAKKYSGTTAGEYAQLLAAESLFTDGKYPEAQQAFSKFLDEHESSPLVPQARVGLAASLEGQGKISDAAQKYQEIILKYPNQENIVSPAKLTLARLDESLNKPDQAFTFYQELARSQNPYDPWAGEARERGELLLAKNPELRKKLQQAAVAAAPAATPASAAGSGMPSFSKPAATSSTPAPATAPKK